jgi:hypothetical protein
MIRIVLERKDRMYLNMLFDVYLIELIEINTYGIS